MTTTTFEISPEILATVTGGAQPKSGIFQPPMPKFTPAKIEGGVLSAGVPLSQLVSCGDPRLVPEYHNGKVHCSAD